MSLSKNKTTRALILIMGALVLVGIVVAKIYYGNVNTSADPRVVHARKMYEKYNTYAQHNAFDSIFYLLDNIEAVYTAQQHYSQSFEVGVVNNNRAAAYLTLALYSPLFKADSNAQDSLINLAEKATIASISIYDNWLSTFNEKNSQEIEELIAESFNLGLSSYSLEEKESFLEKRILEIQDAQLETTRRLSVSHTNLGIIYRHREQYQKAANSYTHALELWNQNLTAENNLNILLGKPLKKRTMLQKLFPPERK